MLNENMEDECLPQKSREGYMLSFVPLKIFGDKHKLGVAGIAGMLTSRPWQIPFPIKYTYEQSCVCAEHLNRNELLLRIHK